MATHSARATLTMASGRKFSVIGTSDDAAEALAERNAKLALTKGTVIASSTTTPDTVIPTSAGAGDGEDAVLKLFKTGETIKTVKFENMDSGLALAGSPGIVDITEGAIVAFGAAYRDGNGIGGYTVLSGVFDK